MTKTTATEKDFRVGQVWVDGQGTEWTITAIDRHAVLPILGMARDVAFCRWTRDGPFLPRTPNQRDLFKMIRDTDREEGGSK